MKEFIEKATEMLKKAGLSHTYLKDVFDDSAQNKAELNELLGLSPDNHFRKTIPLDMNDKEFFDLYPFVSEVFNGIPGWAGPLKPTTGKLTVGKDQVNITKFLSKALTDGAVPKDYKEYLMAKLGIDLTNPKAESQIVPKFGELLNKKATNVLVISTNPFDFFTSSAGDFKYAAFKSCFRPGGEYFNGCNSLSRDTFSTIAYKASADKLDYKHGRAWMFILDQIVAQTKSYGTFTATERKLAREYAQGRLIEKHALSADEFRHHKVQKWGKSENKMVLYFDDYDIDLGYPKDKYPAGFNDRNVPKIRFQNARCLKCGKETQYPLHGLCGVCSGNYRSCAGCNADLYGGKDIRVNGVSYCPDCVALKFDHCANCGNYFEKGTHTDIDGSKICPACIRDRYFFCDYCNEYHNRNDFNMYTITDLGKKWCSRGVKKDAFVCSDCGKHHSKAVLNKAVVAGTDRTICSTCITQYSTCAQCGTFFKGGHDTCDGIVCSTCFVGYDFCVHCTQFVPKDHMQANGEVMACATCCTKMKVTQATYDDYLKEVDAIIGAVKVAEVEKTGNAVAMLQALKEDRARTGFVEGDVLRVIADTSYHQYPIGTLITNCKKYVGVNESIAYCTFRNKQEWFVRAADVEFARPAMVPGDAFTYDREVMIIDAVTTAPNDAIVFSSGGANYPAELCQPTDVIDPKALTAISYKAGEVVQICGMSSKHPFAEDDKVKIVHVDNIFGFTRYVVKKGTKMGYIFGSLADIVKPAKEVAEVAPAVKRAPKKKAARPDEICF